MTIKTPSEHSFKYVNPARRSSTSWTEKDRFTITAYERESFQRTTLGIQAE